MNCEVAPRIRIGRQRVSKGQRVGGELPGLARGKRSIKASTLPGMLALASRSESEKRMH